MATTHLPHRLRLLTSTATTAQNLRSKTWSRANIHQDLLQTYRKLPFDGDGIGRHPGLEAISSHTRLPPWEPAGRMHPSDSRNHKHKANRVFMCLLNKNVNLLESKPRHKVSEASPPPPRSALSVPVSPVPARRKHTLRRHPSDGEQHGRALWSCRRQLEGVSPHLLLKVSQRRRDVCADRTHGAGDSSGFCLLNHCHFLLRF